MKKVKFSHNHKTDIIHLILKYKDLQFLTKIFPLLDINSTTMVVEDWNRDITVTEHTDSDLLNTMQKYKLDPKVISVLFLDGYIIDFKSENEINYLTKNLIRFFITVDYIENEIHVLLNAKKYEKKLKNIQSLI